MSTRFTENKFPCPHSFCSYEGLFYLGDELVVEDVQWWFYTCPACVRWVATSDQVNIVRLFDLDFVPLLNRPANHANCKE